jgi:hypothetical protein
METTEFVKTLRSQSGDGDFDFTNDPGVVAPVPEDYALLDMSTDDSNCGICVSAWQSIKRSVFASHERGCGRF